MIPQQLFQKDVFGAKFRFNLVKTPSKKRTEVTVDTLKAEVVQHRPPHYQTTAEQQKMFARLAKVFPNLEIIANFQERLPHDRYILLTRDDGSQARIGIGAGLDFIRYNGEARATDIVIEDPLL